VSWDEKRVPLRDCHQFVEQIILIFADFPELIKLPRENPKLGVRKGSAFRTVPNTRLKSAERRSIDLSIKWLSDRAAAVSHSENPAWAGARGFWPYIDSRSAGVPGAKRRK
jgi:hypothetical protein